MLCLAIANALSHWPEIPDELAQLVGGVKQATVPGIVLDPFIGSGTTLKTAHEMGLRGIGLDLSADYLEQQALPRAERKQTQDSVAELPLFAELETP